MSCLFNTVLTVLLLDLLDLLLSTFALSSPELEQVNFPGVGINKVSLITHLTLNTNVSAHPLCFLTLSESAPSSLLSDFQPVLPLGSFSLQTGASAAAALPQVAAICCTALPALPVGRWTLDAHR